MKTYLIIIGKSLLIMVMSAAFLAIATRVFPPPKNDASTGMVVGILVVMGVTSVIYAIVSAIWRHKESFLFKAILVTNLLIALFSVLSISI